MMLQCISLPRSDVVVLRQNMKTKQQIRVLQHYPKDNGRNASLLPRKKCKNKGKAVKLARRRVENATEENVPSEVPEVWGGLPLPETMKDSLVHVHVNMLKPITWSFQHGACDVFDVFDFHGFSRRKVWFSTLLIRSYDVWGCLFHFFCGNQ